MRHPLLLVFIGGCLGGAMRVEIDFLAPPGETFHPAIVVINVLGSFALGVVTGWGIERGARWWMPLIGPGLLGGFTTFSAIAAVHWSLSTSVPAALLALALTMVATVIAAAAGWGVGMRAGRRVTQP